MRYGLRALCLVAMIVCATAASAHFQLVYTPEVNFDKPADLPFKLVFWDPMSNGHVMGKSCLRHWW